MANLSQVENALERLMPRGLGDDTRTRLELVLDGLAAEVPRQKRRWKPLLGIAASLVAVLGAGKVFLSSEQGSMGVGLVAAAEPEFRVLEKGWWLEEGQDEGIQPASDDGAALRAWSFSAVEEERLLHAPTGYTVILQREVEGEHYFPTSL